LPWGVPWIRGENDFYLRTSELLTIKFVSNRDEFLAVKLFRVLQCFLGALSVGILLLIFHVKSFSVSV